MELFKNTTKIENAVTILAEELKNKKNKKGRSQTLPADLRKDLIDVLKKNHDLVTVQGGKIILSVQFYQLWIKKYKLNQKNKDIDSKNYLFFKKLRKYRYIHPKSSYFPKKLALISLNPTLPSTYKGNMRYLSNYIKGKESLYLSSDSHHNLIDTYIDLRLYQPVMLTDKETKEIKTSNIIFINEYTAYIYIEDKGIFDNIEVAPYRLICINGLKLINFLKHNNTIYPFSDDILAKQLSKHRKEFFSEINFQEIKMSARNHILMNSTPLETTLATSRTIMSQTTIAELNSLYPSTVPQHLFTMETQRINNALTRTKEIKEELILKILKSLKWTSIFVKLTLHDYQYMYRTFNIVMNEKDIDDEENLIDSSFSLDEFNYFPELIKTNNNSSFMKKIEPSKKELAQYANSKKPEPHGILISKYILHLLKRVTADKKSRKIVISTFRNYYSLVKKHLFNNVDDLSNVQTHEISEILQNLAINKYKDKSIAKVRGRITDFFSFHRKQHNVIPMNLASYPKSLVLEHEIDPILAGIEDMYDKGKQGTATSYERLRDKAIVLMARYTGLRKSELRSRLMKDIYIYENELCIDVNIEGLRKLDLRLKTGSAKRRVCTKITNNDHLEIITKYMEVREKVRNKNSFLFLHVDDHNKIKSKVVKEDVFNQIGKIIQEVTDRYTSFHSLRHTFATYAVRDILLCNKVNPYKMIDLAVKMGHTSPEITLKKYTHRSVIEDMLTNKDNK